jgi:hypothetical protein
VFRLPVTETPVGPLESVRTEWYLVGIRCLGIGLLVPSVALAQLEPDRLAIAILVLVLGFVYIAAMAFVLRHWPELLDGGRLTTCGDTLFIITMLQTGGGFESSPRSSVGPTW